MKKRTVTPSQPCNSLYFIILSFQVEGDNDYYLLQINEGLSRVAAFLELLRKGTGLIEDKEENDAQNLIGALERGDYGIYEALCRTHQSLKYLTKHPPRTISRTILQDYENSFSIAKKQEQNYKVIHDIITLLGQLSNPAP